MHPAACRVLKCAGLQKEESDLTEDDVAHMKHVNAYCKVCIWHAQGYSLCPGVVNAAAVISSAQIVSQANPVVSLSSVLVLCASLSEAPVLQRHLKQRPKKDVESSKWRYSLMNW